MVFNTIEGCGWESVSETYRENPLCSLDVICLTKSQTDSITPSLDEALVCMEDTPNTSVCTEDTPSTPVRTEDTPNTPVCMEDTHSKNSGNHSKSSRDRKRQQCRHPFSGRVGHKAEVMRSNYRVDSLNKISQAKSPECNAGGAGRGTKRRRDALGKKKVHLLLPSPLCYATVSYLYIHTTQPIIHSILCDMAQLISY